MTHPRAYPQKPNSSETPQVSVLISWIEQQTDPVYVKMRQEAKKDIDSRRGGNWLGKPTRFILGLVIAKAGEFYGRALVSETLEGHSQLTANLVSVSSLFNFFTNYPLLFFAFKDLGGLAWMMALATNALIMKFTNGTATAVSARRHSNRAWSQAGIAGMLLMSTLQSVVAGVGTELLLNQSGIGLFKAEELIREQSLKVEALKKLDNPQYVEVQNLCQAGEKELNGMNRSNPRWDSLFVQLYGPWSQRNRNWSTVPLENLPTCRQADRLRQESYRAYETAKAHWEKLAIARNKLGNDVVFLKQEMPLVYQQHFTEDGNMRSGTEAARIAILSSWVKISTGDVGGWGFPLFFLLLSLITSGAACYITIAHTHRYDTQLSFNEAIATQRDRWLESRRQELVALHAKQNKDMSPRRGLKPTG